MFSTRRDFIVGTTALGVMGGCAGSENPQNSSETKSTNPEEIAAQKQEIDRRVKIAEAYLYKNVEGAVELQRKSVGTLIIPLVTGIRVFYGGSFGQGALKVKNKVLGYYSAAAGSFGLQVGVHQYAHALFFLTDRALKRFDSGQGRFTLGTDVTYAIKKEGGMVGIDTDSAFSSIVAVVFAQTGFVVGVSLAGTKYSRLNLLST